MKQYHESNRKLYDGTVSQISLDYRIRTNIIYRMKSVENYKEKPGRRHFSSTHRHRKSHNDSFRWICVRD